MGIQSTVCFVAYTNDKEQFEDLKLITQMHFGLIPEYERETELQKITETYLNYNQYPLFNEENNMMVIFINGVKWYDGTFFCSLFNSFLDTLETEFYSDQLSFEFKVLSENNSLIEREYGQDIIGYSKLSLNLDI